MTEFVIWFVSGLGIAIVVTILILAGVGHRWGSDQPDAYRKAHDRPISRLGGLSVFIAFLAGVLWLLNEAGGVQGRWWDEWSAVVIPSCMIFLVGFVDDLRPLGARIKLIGQVGAALTAWSLGLGIDKLTNPMGGTWETIPLALSFLLTMGWLIALPNLVNLIDGMDGLASGISLFLCLTLGAIAMNSEQVDAVLLAMIVGGSLLGFLFFNFPPAKIFLGDGGAYFIGFFIASVSLTTNNKSPIVATLLVIVVALGLPILDTTFAIIRRGIRGLPLFRADADHIHHRLLLLGFSKGTALIALYAVCLVLSLIALGIMWSDQILLPVAGLAIFLLALFAARYLGYVRTWRDLRHQVRRALRQRSEIQYANLLGDLMEIEVDRCHGSVEYWRRFDDALSRVSLYRHRESAMTDRALVKLTLSIPHQPGWTLFRPADTEVTRNWAAMAECFYPAWSRAQERWGAAPAAIGEASDSVHAVAPEELADEFVAPGAAD